MTPSVTRQRRSIGINPEVLKWAREWRGRTTEDVAKKLGKQPADIEAWEQGKKSPTVRQARELAGYYDRPFLEFFLDLPPELTVPDLVPDYRMHAGQVPRQENRDLQAIQQWAESKRTDALDLFRELGIEIPRIPAALFATLEADPEELAVRSRDAMGFPIHEQMKLTRSDAFSMPVILRARLERLGVLTLRRPDLKDFRARGICIARFPLPVIVVQNEAATAQAFTLVHEFGHILLRESAITGDRVRAALKGPVEAWCDRFAAAFLMPRGQIEALIGVQPKTPQARIEDDDLQWMSNTLRVSSHAALIRLVQLGYVEESYYWDVKKPQFDREAREARSFGRAKYYGVRYRSKLGDLFTGLVLEAWSTGRITNHNAAEYMEIKQLDHLEDIRREFSQA